MTGHASEISRQGDGFKTRWPRHLQRSCPLDNHSKIWQLSVLSTWLISCVLLAHANPPAVMRDFLSTNTLFTLFNPGIQRCPSDSGIYCPRGKDLDLDGSASWMFWIPISFKIQAGVFLGFATLEKNTYGSILMIGYRRFGCCSADCGLYVCPRPAHSMHRQPPLIRLVPSPTTAQPESE